MTEEKINSLNSSKSISLASFNNQTMRHLKKRYRQTELQVSILPPLSLILGAQVSELYPKKYGGWRLIYHLSAPTNQSINGYIDSITYSLQYSTIDDAIKICHEVGKGVLLAKVDLKSAFRLCPVRPDNWHLLGICWHGQFYVDKYLPFGLRSAPFLFNMVADSLEWILWHHFHQGTQ